MSEETGRSQLVVFTLNGEPYAVPIKQVQEIIRYTRPRRIASADPWVQGVLNLRGKIIPVYDLAARIGSSADVGEESKIVILDTGSQTVGMIVDAVDEVLTVHGDQLGDVPSADPTLIEAIAKLDQRLVVLLNPSTIFDGLAAA